MGNWGKTHLQYILQINADMLFAKHYCPRSKGCAKTDSLKMPKIVKNGQIWKKSTFWNFEAKNFEIKRKNQNSGFYKFFVLLNSVSKQKIMFIEQFLRELLDFKGENWTYFKLYWKSYIFGEIGPNFRKLYLERMRRYLHSVKSDDSI